MKKIIIILFLLFSNFLFAADSDESRFPQLYSYLDDSVIFSEMGDDIKDYLDIGAVIEKKYDITLHIEELELLDNHNNKTIFLKVDIISDKAIYDIFNGRAHSSALIMDVAFNLLQPRLSRFVWSIHGLILSLNGKYLQFVNYDASYPTVFTNTMLTTILYSLNE